MNDFEFITSGNSIHHLYHLVKFFKETNTYAKNIETIVESVAHGNMAKIYKHMNEKSTYVIIDIPIFSYIQAVYLKTIYGRQAVHMVGVSGGSELSIKKGSINPFLLQKHLGQDRRVNRTAGPLHKHMGALESNEAMQVKSIRHVDYFKAKYLLLAYQKSTDDGFAFAENVSDIPETYDKAFNGETEYVKDSYYLFCKRKRPPII